MTGAGRSRAVLLIANPAAPYSRGVRVARSLAGAGYDVEIAATTGQGQRVDEYDGPVRIRRYAPMGRWAHLAAALDARGRTGAGPARAAARLAARLAKVVAWPMHVRGWWAALERELPPADLYHAFGILALPIALRHARAARRAGRAGRVVYDVIDVILESNNYSQVPRLILAWYRWRERRWVRRADAVVTVNEPIADHLARTWPLRSRPTVLLNCQPRWDPPAERPDHIRAATGIPPDRRIVLFLGRLGRERGLEEAAAAVLATRDAALVLLGFGPWADELRARDGDPRFAGHHFTLPAVLPDEVPAWTASADVSIIAVPANSLNQRLSSPNKFWESIGAGTPVVIGRELEVMRGIVEEHRLGAIGDPRDPTDLARALSEVLEAPPAEYEAMRDRCLAISHAAYNWEMAVGPYIELVTGLVPVR